MEFTYLWQIARRYTFEQPELKIWLESWCSGAVLNLFAGKVRLAVSEFRVDSSPEFEPDLVNDAFDFVTRTDMLFGTIILDPPYNLRQSREKYNGHCIGSFTKIKNELSSLLSPGGFVISFGYDSVGMSARRGFEKVALCLVCHGGSRNDTICLVEKKVEV